MSHDFRRAVRVALLAGLGFALPAAAQVEIARVSLEAGLGAASAPAAFVGTSLPALSGSFTAPALSAVPAFAAPAFAAAPALAASPAASLPAAAPALAPAAIPTAPAALRAASPGDAPSAGAPALDDLRLAAASRGDSGSRFDGGSSGARSAAAPASAPRGAVRGPAAFIQNRDGAWVGGRVAEQALWINQMEAELSPKVDLGGVLDVMPDAYDEVRVKLASASKAAVDRKLKASSVHLEGTRNWIDAILTDDEGRNIAVHTHRVYFHPAPGNPSSEIAEGIRRADKYLEKVKEDFGTGGRAEQEFHKPFAAVELTFDTRGYKEIADHLKTKEAEFRAAYGDRYHFNYVTEQRMPTPALIAEYNRLVEQYKDQPEGLMGIIDGVTYSREVGVGHELNSHKMRLDKGLRITQAGRDFFDPKTGQYITEFDAKTEPLADAGKPMKDRDIVLWEDKSARVEMDLDKMMEETFLYKLRIYRANKAVIEASQGGAPLKVAFSVDVGGLVRRAAKQGALVWRLDPDTGVSSAKELMEHLQASEAALSKEYGFPVSFYFVNSHPGEDPYLFYKTPMAEADWWASQGQGRLQNGSGRKHGRNGGR